jgi:transposase
MTEENANKQSAKAFIKDIKRKTYRRYSSEEKIKIIIEGLRGEESIASLCRKYGISDAVYYKWNKDFLEAGKKRLSGDTEREANSTEVQDLRKENESLKKAVAELFVENSGLKKTLTGME